MLSASVISCGYLVTFFNLRHQDQEQHINGHTNRDYNCADPASDGLDFGISINGTVINGGMCQGTEIEVRKFFWLMLFQKRFLQLDNDSKLSASQTECDKSCLGFVPQIEDKYGLSKSYCLKTDLQEIKIDSNSEDNRLNFHLKKCNPNNLKSNKTCQPASAIQNFFSSHKISVDWIQGDLAQENMIEFPDDNNTFRVPKDTFYSTQYSLDANFRKEA